MITALPQLLHESPAAFWLLIVALAYFAWMGPTLAVIDARTHLLPDRIVLPSYAVAVPTAGAAWLSAGPLAALQVVAIAAALWVVFFILRFINPAGMGFGDVKLAGVLGLYLGVLGWAHALAGIFIAFVLAALYGVAVIALRKATLKTTVPFGPFLILGTTIGLLLPATV